MLKSAITSVVKFCTTYPWLVIVAALVVTGAAGTYTARNFAINTDINTLISPDLPWRQREIAFDQAFPARNEMILAVVEAPTAELAAQAAAALTQRLSAESKLFISVRQPDGGEFFARNGLLFQSVDEVKGMMGRLAQGGPVISILARDQSLRGLGRALQLALLGIKDGRITLDGMAGLSTSMAQTIEDVIAGKPASVSWTALLSGKPPTAGERRRFIEIRPVLDYAALEPGRVATEAIRGAVASLDVGSRYQAQVRLTGPVPIADEEFATVQDGALTNGIGTVIVVLFILWMALKSGRIILAVFLTIMCGLAITAALGLMMVGALNLISVAFAVLFVGLGVDFGIQFSVRYRAERHEMDNLRVALRRTAQRVGAPLTLAAAATAAGFLSFLPTAYRGVSELGKIAGAGMFVAFIVSITLIPALLTIFAPAGEKEPLGYAALAPVDDFLERRRIPVIVCTLLVAIAGLPLLYFLSFDFNPLNLRNPKVESIATFLDLRRDPETGANSINVLAPSMGAATQIAQRLGQLPGVARVMTLESFVPADQKAKIDAIAPIEQGLGPLLAGQGARTPPTDAENVEALNDTANALTAAAEGKSGAGADAARRFAAALTQLAAADPKVRERADAVFVTPLKVAFAELANLLRPQQVTLASLPRDLVDQWQTKDGQVRVEVQPKGDPNDNETLRQFARAVEAVEPTATGGPISILESGRTIVGAFIQAGLWALISIAILLWIVLRRFGDVLLTLVPLLLAGVVTLEICVLIGLKLNFANIIALPLLLGIGVAFKIYYIMAWRAGQTGLLQSSLTRAVIFSAMTTATAFGSLWLSSHPGTSSMGKLLALSLACTLAAAVLFQPALMGRPRALQDSGANG